MAEQFKIGDVVEFCVLPGEHNPLAGRPGKIVGKQGEDFIVLCTELGTIHHGSKTITPIHNLRHISI